MHSFNKAPSFAIVALLLAAGCSSSNTPTEGQGGSSGSTTAGSGGVAGSVGSGGRATGVSGNGGATSGAGGASGGMGGSAGSGGAGGSGGAQTVGDCSPPADLYSPIQKLSLTGCVDPTDPTKMIARAVPYEVNSPLWSDGADKTRAFILPAGGKIHVDAASGKWVFPVGSVLIKNFLFDNKFVETRLFMHVDDMTWVGYGYEWDGQAAAKQTDATIVGIGGDEVMFNTGSRTVDWFYPSRADCLGCHNDVAGDSLGPSNMQMYRVNQGQTVNQFDQFEQMGLFDTTPTKPTADQVLIAPYTTSLGSPPQNATVDQKARSYLQANCAHCHQPNVGDNQSVFPNFDLRFATAFKDIGICNAAVTQGMVPGSTSSTIFEPGDPTDSVILVRMKEPYTDQNGSGRMPKIGTHVVDTQGVQLISDWITSIKTCP